MQRRILIASLGALVTLTTGTIMNETAEAEDLDKENTIYLVATPKPPKRNLTPSHLKNENPLRSPLVGEIALLVCLGVSHRANTRSGSNRCLDKPDGLENDNIG